MKVEFTHKFRKQVEKSANKKIKKRLFQIINTAEQAQSLSTIPNLKKLKGHNNIFRIRMGDYRIGLQIMHKTIIFAAFDHRSDIYKYFP